MQVFTSEEFHRSPGDVQESALTEPTFITVRGQPRLVIMSLDEFDRLRGRGHTVLKSVALSDDLLGEMRRVADEHPIDAPEIAVLGGLMRDEAGSGAPGPG